MDLVLGRDDAVRRPEVAVDTDPDDIDTVTDAVLTASRLLIAVSARSIAAVDDMVTMPQFRLLVVLASRGPLKLTTLADHLGVNPSTATRAVDRLITAHMVTRRTNPASRREIVVDLTPAGHDVVTRVTERRRAEIARIVSRMPVDRRQGLVDALVAFTDAGSEPAATRPSGTGWV
jgi:DNA-binding MarR family transcriptional regulator